MPEKQKQPENPRLYAMLLFVLYFLIFQLAESAVNDRTVEVLNADAVNGVYAAGLFFTASGYLLFAFWYRRFGITARKGIFISSGAVYLLCVLMIHCTNQPVVFLLTAAGCRWQPDTLADFPITYWPLRCGMENIPAGQPASP